MPGMSSGQGGDRDSGPYVELDRSAWASLAAATEQPLTPDEIEHRRDLYYAARAIDNGIYVVLSGLTGRCGDRDFCGGSAVYDPEGRPVARAGAEDPAVVVADLDPTDVARVQGEVNPVARDRLDGLGPRDRVILDA